MLSFLNKVRSFKYLMLVSLVVSFVSFASANVIKDTYHNAKDSAKKVYHKGKKAAKNVAETVYGAEKKSLKFYAKIGEMVIKRELKLINYLMTTPRYVVTEFITKNRKRPLRRPDLTISKLYKDKNGNVIVELKNIGRGFVVIKPKKNFKTVDLYFKINGKNWGGITHKIFDSRARLVKPGGKVTYKSNIKINKNTKVTAIIDFHNSVIESNEKNNRKTVFFKTKHKVNIKPITELKPSDKKELASTNHTKIQTTTLVNDKITRYKQKPDLVIKNIFLTKNCKVAVQVENIGKGNIPNSIWTNHKPTSSSVYLLRNGKKWGGATLYHFDARRRLQKPGGKALFISNLKILKNESITAIVDMTNEIKESNENNNKMTKTLSCQNF